MKNSGIHRYTNIDLPRYRYIPCEKNEEQKASKHTHIPAIPDLATLFSINNWKNSERYLYAIDLFNYGYYWEVHEVLEKLWLLAGKTSETGIFIQGFIQLSIGMVKKIELNANGVERLKAKAIPKLQSQNGIYLGIELNELVNQFEKFIGGEKSPNPVISLHFE